MGPTSDTVWTMGWIPHGSALNRIKGFSWRGRWMWPAGALSLLMAIGCGADDDQTFLRLPQQVNPPLNQERESELKPIDTGSPAGELDGGVQTLLGDAALTSCVPGGLSCTLDVLRKCSVEGIWQQVERCATVRLCEDTITQCRVAPEVCEGRPTACLPAVCEKFERRCTGTVSEICNANRTGFDVLRDCGVPCSGSACDPVEGCRKQFCEPGQVSCSNAIDEGPAICNSTCTAFGKPSDPEAPTADLFCDDHNSQ